MTERERGVLVKRNVLLFTDKNMGEVNNSKNMAIILDKSYSKVMEAPWQIPVFQLRLKM